MITERRAHARKIPTEFTYIQLEQEFGGRVLNYSKEGLCFEISSPICSTDLVQFWLSVQRHNHIDGVGRITWLSEKRNVGGIVFVHLSPTSRQRIDKWAGAVSEENAANVGNNPKTEESPEDVVAQIMQQVLTERRRPPVGVSPAMTHARGAMEGAVKAREVDHREGARSASPSAIKPPAPDAMDSWITNPAAFAELDAPEPAETRNCATAPAAGTPDEYPDSINVSGAATDTAPEPEVTERNSPALYETASEQVAVAPKQINAVTAAVAEPRLHDAPIPEWPALSSFPGTTHIEQTEGSKNRDSSPEETKELVPLRQYRYARRSQFIRGAAIGILLATVIAISLPKFWKTDQQGLLAEGARNAVSVNSNVAKADNIREPTSAVSPGGQTRGFKSSPSSQKPQNVISPGKSPVAAFAPVAAPASAQESLNAPANAVPRPDTFANRDSAGSGFQPLFHLSQPNNLVLPTADVQAWSGQFKVRVDLGSTPWTFRRRNIHGTPPVGGEVSPAQLVSSVAPHYPESAKTQHISGEVVIDAMIDAQGIVRNPKVVSGPMAFRAAAVNAVSSWKYKPAMLNGKPTESHATITLQFRDQ